MLHARTAAQRCQLRTTATGSSAKCIRIAMPLDLKGAQARGSFRMVTAQGVPGKP
jgi:hypothetical protein